MPTLKKEEHKASEQTIDSPGAVHKGLSEANVPEQMEKPTTAIVPVTGTTGQEVEPWDWTKQRRLAFRLLLEGKRPVEVAKQLGVHRNTIRNWTKSPEWISELRTRLQEKQLSTKLRRINGVENLADQLETAAATELSSGKIQNVPAATAALREFRAFVELERGLFGESTSGGTSGAQPSGGNVNINIGGNATAEVSGKGLDAMSFAKFVEGVTTPGEAVEADSAAEALLLKTRDVLRDTDLLERIQEEDDLQARAENAEIQRKKK